MCGIVGILAANPLLVSAHRLGKMTDSIAHRGPDGDGCWINDRGTIGLGHRRLAVIDLSPGGAQPMHLLPGSSPSQAGESRYTITYNGEIYNYIEIKASLVKLGYRFVTSSDTEVVLAAYDYWKQDCVHHFDGMFAFGIWDNHESKLFAARDRFGEKPFYYYQDQDQFIFASEMKAIWTAGVQKKRDDKMLFNYLTLGYVQNANNKEQTFFQDIYSLPPGHYLEVKGGSFMAHVYSYWDINKEIAINISDDAALEQFTTLFTTSVSRRLRSDVAVGTSLSGGLDSSSIASTIFKLQGSTNALNTFSAVFPGFSKDESAFIKMVVSQVNGIPHSVTPTAAGLVEDFQRLCYHQEEPFGSSSIYAQFKVFELAKKNQVKVLLDGQGADETQGGYHKYIPWYLQQLLNRNKFVSVVKEMTMFSKKKIDYQWGPGNLLAAFLPTHASVQLERREYRRAIHHPYINPQLVDSLRGREWEGIHKPIITKLNDMLYFNTCVLGLEELLRFADRNSMAHGVEVRLPFLHHELVSFLFSLPAHFKIHQGRTKPLLRAAMSRQLPPEIVNRTDKVGFEPPQQTWLQYRGMQDYIIDSKQKLVNHRILQPSVLKKEIIARPAHEKDNFDWRYLCAAQLF